MADTSGAIRFGRAFVELFLDKSNAVRGLKSFASDLTAFGKTMSRAGAFTMGVGTGVAAPMLLAAKSFADAGSALHDMSERTGASVASLSLLRFSADQNGSSLEDLEGTLRKYQKTLSGAVSGEKESADAFASVGLSAKSLINLPIEEQFAKIGERLAMLPEGAIRTGAALKLFGRSGTSILPMLGQLRADMDRAKELGLPWTKEEADRADALGDRWDELKSVAMRTASTIGDTLQPALMELSEPILNAAVATKEFIAANPGVIQNAALVAAGVAATGAAMTTLGITSIVAGAGLKTVASGLAAVLSPIGLTTAAVAGLGYVLVTQTDIGGQAFDYLAGTARDVAGDVVTSWGGITDAIAGNEWALAGQVAMAGLNVVYQRGVREITDIFAVGERLIVGGWIDAMADFKALGAVTVAFVSTAWTNTFNTIASAFDSLTNGISIGLEKIVGAKYDVEIAMGISTEQEKSNALDPFRKDRAQRDRNREQRNQQGAASNAGVEQGLQKQLTDIELERQRKQADAEKEQTDAIIGSERKLTEAQDELASARSKAAEAKAKADKARKPFTPKTKLKPGSENDGTADKPKSDNKQIEGTTSGTVANLRRGFVVPTGPKDQMGELGEQIDGTTEKLSEQKREFGRWRSAATEAIGAVKAAAVAPLPKPPAEPKVEKHDEEAKAFHAAVEEHGGGFGAAAAQLAKDIAEGRKPTPAATTQPPVAPPVSEPLPPGFAEQHGGGFAAAIAAMAKQKAAVAKPEPSPEKPVALIEQADPVIAWAEQQQMPLPNNAAEYDSLKAAFEKRETAPAIVPATPVVATPTMPSGVTPKPSQQPAKVAPIVVEQPSPAAAVPTASQRKANPKPPATESVIVDQRPQEAVVTPAEPKPATPQTPRQAHYAALKEFTQTKAEAVKQRNLERQQAAIEATQERKQKNIQRSEKAQAVQDSKPKSDAVDPVIAWAENQGMKLPESGGDYDALKAKFEKSATAKRTGQATVPDVAAKPSEHSPEWHAADERMRQPKPPRELPDIPAKRPVEHSPEWYAAAKRTGIKPALPAVSQPIKVEWPSAVTAEVVPATIPVTTEQPAAATADTIAATVPVTTSSTPAIAPPVAPSVEIPVTVAATPPIELPDIPTITIPVVLSPTPDVNPPASELTNQSPPVAASPVTVPVSEGMASASSPPVTPPSVSIDSEPLPSLSSTDAALRTFGERLAATSWTPPDFSAIASTMSDMTTKLNSGSGRDSSRTDELLSDVVTVLKSLDARIAAGSALTA